MTPELKANELANKMFNGSVFDYNSKEELNKEHNRAKQCALIAVDEILFEWKEQHKKLKDELNVDLSLTEILATSERWNYWKEVKKEIELL